jgi:hypothetical protein
MGFGLTISKLIIQQLLGEISVKSTVGEGSHFQFDINAEAMPINASLEEMNSIPTEEDCSINTPLLSLANPIDMNKFLLLK